VAHRLCPRLDLRALHPQLVELRQTGCGANHEEHASGADRIRLAFARHLAAIRPGDMLVVVRLDWPARVLAHLLQVIDLLKAKGAKFRGSHRHGHASRLLLAAGDRHGGGAGACLGWRADQGGRPRGIGQVAPGARRDKGHAHNLEGTACPSRPS
jgi:hypothetical protein